VMLMTYSKSSEKILVLVVDLDDDLGREGIKTPVIGYENVLKIAIEYGLKKPNDSDLNAMFSALNIFKKLESKGFDVEISVVSGDQKDPVKASLRVRDSLSVLKKTFGFTSIYFVSDGAYDEKIIPILTGFGNIVGVERVIVEQSRGIEESYILFSRYIKKALTEQPYTRYFLGIPGLILLAYGLLSLMGLTSYVWIGVSLIVGLALSVKGFGVFDQVIEYWKTSPLAGVSLGLSLSLILYTIILDLFVLYLYGFNITSIKNMINLTALPLVTGLILLLSSRIFYKAFKGYPHLIWRDAVLLIPVVFFIIFINNLNNELAKMSENNGFNELTRLFSMQYIYLPLLLAIVITIIMTLFFIILDIIIMRRIG